MKEILKIKKKIIEKKNYSERKGSLSWDEIRDCESSTLNDLIAEISIEYNRKQLGIAVVSNSVLCPKCLKDINQFIKPQQKCIKCKQWF